MRRKIQLQRVMILTVITMVAMMLCPMRAMALYLTDVAVASSTAASEASNLLTNAGYTCVGDNMNKGTSSGYTVYVGIKYSNTFTQDAITGLLLRRSGTLSDLGETFTYEGRTYHRAKSYGSNNQNGNLNIGSNNNAYVCLYYTRDGNTRHGVSPIMIMDARAYDQAVNSTNNTMSGTTFVPCLYGSTLYQYYDINKDCGGKYAYIYYTVNHAHNIQISDIGYSTHHAKCTLCECDVTEAHSYDNSVKWNWTNDHSQCKAVFHCAICGYDASMEAEVTHTSAEATCTKDGYDKYVATRERPGTGEPLTDEKTDIIPALGHDYQDDFCTRCHDCKAPQLASDGYYEIDSYGKLLWYLKQRNGSYININGRLTSDIDASGHAASLYPSSRSLGQGYTFDGNQHTISGLTIASGLFDGNYGTIKNLGICESEMTGKAGAIAYMNMGTGTILNCFSYGNKISNGGGIVYTNAGGSKMSGCWSAGVSKLCAYNYGSVSNSYAYAATDAREVTGGALCYALCHNGSDVWRQTLGSDLRPVWNNTHAVVYATTPCHSYNNNGPATLEHNYVEVGSVTNCLTESYKTMHCTQCLEDIRTDVAILGHHFEDGACIRCQLEAPHNPLCFTAGEDQATVCLSKVGDPTDVSLMYSTNGTDWYNYAVGTTLTLNSQGDKVYMAAQVKNEYFARSLLKYYQYVLQKSIAASGDITTLLDAGGTLTILNTAFYRLFMNCSSLTQAPELPATTIGVQCYQSMFQGCTSLTQAPELPARSLTFGCYNSMFKGCTSLTQAPELPATTMANNCYSGMFNGCTSLTQAPELPATTMAECCYSSMFYGCTSLTQAPQLPATTMAEKCYFCMFEGCTSLTKAPSKLPAATMATECCSSMFFGCTLLTQAPELSATTMAEYCYSNMFEGCTSLTQAPELPATTMAKYCYSNMFYGCTSLTQAPELPATTMAEYCYEGMFQGCTSLTQAPELPATTMAQACYAGMFEGCTSLRIAEIGATTLADACFRQMFHDCTSLRSLTIHYAQWDYPKASCWLKNTGDSESIFYCPKGFAAPTERNEETIPENWTIVNGMPGDMNEDSNYSIADITLLLNHIQQKKDWNAIPDMNNDLEMNVDDVKLLEKKVLTR